MRLQPITLRGRTVAAATPTRSFLGDELDSRPAADPERLLVAFMCLYAREILLGELTGPYTDQDARDFAHACLTPLELPKHEWHAEDPAVPDRPRPIAAGGGRRAMRPRARRG